MSFIAEAPPRPSATAVGMRWPVRVINLQAHAERWRAVQAQLVRAGLAPQRLDAVCGFSMAACERSALYSEVLNRRQYHRPLQPGEIGCYASHLAAWSELLASRGPAMVVFEDDVQIDADLPAVLGALAHWHEPWDVIKLIGRDNEKLLTRQPLLPERDLVTYRRVPSLTGAYLVSAEGARKLLARRRPFGRPVDVDLRYWWECGLTVRGAYPYPVHPAPLSDESTIGDRKVERSGSGRLRKLALQAHYTCRNHIALQVTPRSEAAAPPKALERRTATPRRASGLRRNLVVLRAGDDSLHRGWLDRPDRDFDLCISYYGAHPGRHEGDGEFYETRPGPKWPGIAALFEARPELAEQYEAYWFPDDDLAADGALLDRMFAFACAYRLCLAQPALTHDSFYTWDTLLQDRACQLRYSRFVEVMAPIFSRDALRVCRHTFAQSNSGWGLDWVWPTLCARAGLGRIAILDATPVRHTRPVGGGALYRNHPSMQPRQDAERLLRAYGIEEVRAVAKYSFEGRVRDEPLPIGQRLLYWLKRLNGRRKHRAPA